MPSTAESNTSGLTWSPEDAQAVTYLRALAMDAVQRVGNGHPGTAMALAPVAYLLFRRLCPARSRPIQPGWVATASYCRPGIPA